jgi:hypothetical protein
MYRIELAPGEEALFRNMDELAKGIHTGVIGPHARIWHGASNKWLPIDFHPHYKIAKERPAPLATPVRAPKAAAEPRFSAPIPASVVAPILEAPILAAAPTPAPSPAVRTREIQFIELEPPREPKPAGIPGNVGSHVFLQVPKAPKAPTPEPKAAAPEPATPRHIEALVAMAADAPATEHHDDMPEVTIDISAPPSRFNRRSIGMAAAGLVTLAGLSAMLMSRGPASADEPEMTVASTSLAATPNTRFEIEAPSPASGIPVDVVPPSTPRGEVRTATDSAAPIIPAAPSLSASRAPISIAESSLTDVSNDALSDLANRLRASGLSNLFAPSRLAAGQVGSTRLAAAGAANLVRDYRAKSTRKESAQAARAGDALLADIESLLGVLADNEGGYEISGNEVTFSDESLADTYGMLRSRITAAVRAGDSASAVTGALVGVIGKTAPPAVAKL